MLMEKAGFTHEVKDQNGFEINCLGADEGEYGTDVCRYGGTNEDVR